MADGSGERSARAQSLPGAALLAVLLTLVLGASVALLTAQAGRPWRLIAGQLVLAALLGPLAWYLGARAASRSARRLARLSEACAEAAAGRRVDLAPDPAGDGIAELSGRLGLVLDAQARSLARLEERIAGMSRAYSDEQLLFRAVIDESPDLIQVKDWDGKILFANRRLAELCGMTPEQMIGCDEASINPDKDQVAFELEHGRAVIRCGCSQVCQEERKDPRSGETRFYQTVKMPLRAPDAEARLLVIAHDVTALHEAHRAVTEQERRYAYAVAATDEGLWDWDITHDVVTCNAKWCELLGLDSSQLLRRVEDFYALVHEADRDAVATTLRRALAGTSEYRMEFRMRRADGRTIWVQDRGDVVERNWEGLALRMVGCISDISARRQAELKLRQAASVFMSSQDAIMISDDEGRIIDVNPAFTRITGYAREDALGQHCGLIWAPDEAPEIEEQIRASLAMNGSWRGERWSRRKDGRLYAQLMSIDQVRDDGAVVRQVAIFSDISHIKEHEAELDRIAHHDSLTGAPNRLLLAERLERAIARARRSGRMLALCYLDLDGFKDVNDHYGHAAGDKLLVEIASRLRRVLREEDTLSRLGGDEFALLFCDLDKAEDADLVIDRVLGEVRAPVALDERTAISVSASLGVSFFPTAAADAEALLGCADQAMYQAKKAGKDKCQRFPA